MKKQNLKNIEEIPSKIFEWSDVEKAINQYWDKTHHSKTPAMIDFFDLKNELKKILEEM